MSHSLSPLVDRHFSRAAGTADAALAEIFQLALWAGITLSRFAGPGQEFLDHRNFHEGDDLRARELACSTCVLKSCS